MNKSVALGFGLLALAGSTVSAFAADMGAKPIYKAPPPVAVSNWTGFYVGIQGGYTWGRAEVAHSAIVAVPGAAFAIDAAAVTAASSPSMRLEGWTFGGHAGYNVQFSQWLVGVETDFSYFRLRGNQAGTFPFPSTPALTFTANTTFETDWLFTFRPRAGVILGDSLLAYVAGGLAVTNEKLSQVSGVLNAATFNSTISDTRLGWAFGGGLEYAFARNWSIRAEYLHLDFGTTNGTGNLVIPAGVTGNAVCTAAQGLTVGPAILTGCGISNRLTAEVVRGGISYRF